jgi:exopolysaccharide biosynthesis protein
MTIRILAAAAFAAAAVPCEGQDWDSASTREVAPGVTHNRYVANSGPWRINVLVVNLEQPGVIVRGVRANDSSMSRETVSSMVARYKGPGRAIAGINADFFNVRTGESENNVVIEGRIAKGITVTDSPHETFDNVHYQFGVDYGNNPMMERFTVSATLHAPGRAPIRLEGINAWPDSNTIVLYTRDYGSATPADTSGRRPTLVPLRLQSRRGETMEFIVAGNATEGGTLPLVGGGVLAASGEMREVLRSIGRRGGKVRVSSRIVPAKSRVRTVVGGWPAVVMNGRSIAEYAGILEGTFPRFEGRNPRSAVGFSKDSSTLYLLTVDGRRPTDAGMTLVELARTMLRLGVYNGMNFDGGGSTAMVIEGKVVNRPSDQTGERAVGSGLLVVVDADK